MKNDEKINTTVAGSICYFLALPVVFALAGIFLFIDSLTILYLEYQHKETIIFTIGTLSGFAIGGTLGLRSYRTFIHEFKHAVLVILTGNRLKDFSVAGAEGFVDYMLYSNKVRFAPFISLAPYVLPLFSFPLFIAALVFGEQQTLFFCYFLGATFGIDAIFGFQEIGPHQTDLNRLGGGFVYALSFIICNHLLFFSIYLLWALNGINGFKLASWLVWKAISMLGAKYALKMK